MTTNLTSVILTDQIHAPGAKHAHMTARTFNARDGYQLQATSGALLIERDGRTMAVPLSRLTSADVTPDQPIDGTPLDAVTFGTGSNGPVRISDPKHPNMLGTRAGFTAAEGYTIALRDGLVIVTHPTSKKRHAGAFANCVDASASAGFDVAFSETDHDD